MTHWVSSTVSEKESMILEIHLQWIQWHSKDLKRREANGKRSGIHCVIKRDGGNEQNCVEFRVEET